MTGLPKGHEHVTGEIKDTEFLSWPISGKAANEGSTMTEQDNYGRLIDVLTALQKDGGGWEDVAGFVRNHFEKFSGTALPSLCERCGTTDDTVWCEQCFAEGDYHCGCCDMDPICKVCNMDVTHPLCEDHLDADVYTDLGLSNKDARAWCATCSAIHPQGVCPGYWYGQLRA